MAACMRGWKNVMSAQHVKCTQVGLKNLLNVSIHYTPALCMSSRKHYDPKFRQLRRAKFLWFDKKVFAENTPENELRMMAKKLGQKYPKEDRRISPRVNDISLECSDAIFDEFVPRKGDGRLSPLSKEGLDYYKSRPLSMLADQRSKRVLKKYEDDFNKKELANELQSIYIHTMKLLKDIKKNEEELLEYVTSRCFSEFNQDFRKRTVEWEFVETIEPPQIVSMRTREIIVADNLYTQLTVRMHSKQILAVYDQFGRLMIGSPVLQKNVMEYIVFEKHIVDTYGKWRVHGKVHPDWMQPLGTMIKTINKGKEEKPTELTESSEK